MRYVITQQPNHTYINSYINNPDGRFIPTVVTNTCTDKIRVVRQKFHCYSSVKFNI